MSALCEAEKEYFFCQTLNLLEVTEIKETTIKQIWMIFENIADKSVEICGRDIKDHSFFSTGQTLKVEKNFDWFGIKDIKGV